MIKRMNKGKGDPPKKPPPFEKFEIPKDKDGLVETRKLKRQMKHFEKQREIRRKEEEVFARDLLRRTEETRLQLEELVVQNKCCKHQLCQCDKKVSDACRRKMVLFRRRVRREVAIEMQAAALAGIEDEEPDDSHCPEPVVHDYCEELICASEGHDPDCDCSCHKRENDFMTERVRMAKLRQLANTMEVRKVMAIEHNDRLEQERVESSPDPIQKPKKTTKKQRARKSTCEQHTEAEQPRKKGKQKKGGQKKKK